MGWLKLLFRISVAVLHGRRHDHMPPTVQRWKELFGGSCCLWVGVRGGCGWRIVVLPIFPWDFPSCYDSAMSNLVILLPARYGLGVGERCVGWSASQWHPIPPLRGRPHQQCLLSSSALSPKPIDQVLSCAAPWGSL